MPLNQEQGRKKEKALVDSAHTLLVYELEPCAPCMTWIPSIGFRGQIGSSGICLGPCALARPRLPRHGVGARSDG
ncbi:hypothetical protein BHE74_00044793 [Ensete ventricosum]|nr:hypothetical protein BHE74_00044793 [Ensete ventricosum]